MSARGPSSESAVSRRPRTDRPIEVAGVRITHPGRLVYPDDGVTKGQVANYYAAVAHWILPELINRPLSMVRCPGGTDSACFFQKHHAARLGSSVRPIPLEEKGGGGDDYVYIRDRKGLLQLVQMNAIEFHPWGSRVDKPDSPDRIVLDLDPAPDVAWEAVVEGARGIRDLLADLQLASFVRTSGGKGLHVVVPFRRGPGWQAVKAFCKRVADAMVERAPDRYIATASKAQREGKIFIDWLRNARGATSVCSWSLRSRQGAPVAMPLRWEELGKVGGGAVFGMQAALERAQSLKTDPWEDLARLQQRLPKG